MCLIIKEESNQHHINLLTVSEMTVILSDEYNEIYFCDIIISLQTFNDNLDEFS